MEYGCIGEKLGHSFSKEIHAQLFDYSYELKELATDQVDGFMRARAFRAINVTIPYKQTVIPYLDEIDPAARRIGAVNTIVNRGGRLYGYNTDFSGMTALLQKNGLDPAGKKVLILGSGGTSKTAAAVVSALGAREYFRVSRTGSEGCITYEQAYADHADAQLIINTTPCGMFPRIGSTPVELNRFPRLLGVADAVYNPLRSALVVEAHERGIPAVGGLYMLVAQAVFAAEHFTGGHLPDGTIDRVFRTIEAGKENIVLIGMPGCGKTTLGQALAEALGMDFADSDEEIVKSAGVPIPEIFARQGEEGFRNLEAESIRALAARQHTVIATGGGAVLRRENTTLLRENGKILFLDRPPEMLAVTDDRPLSDSYEKLKKRYEERYELYCAAADVRVDCSGGIAENTERLRKAAGI